MSEISVGQESISQFGYKSHPRQTLFTTHDLPKPWMRSQEVELKTRQNKKGRWQARSGLRDAASRVRV